MKRAACFLCLVLCALADAGSGEASNVVTNPGFESWGRGIEAIEAWQPAGAWRACLGIGTVARRGNRSLFFDTDVQGGIAWVYQNVSVREGCDYVLSVWFKTHVTRLPLSTPGERLGVYIEVLAGDAVLVRRILRGVHDWTQVSARLHVPDRTDSVRVNIGLSGLIGHVWVDDVSMRIVQFTDDATAPSS